MTYRRRHFHLSALGQRELNRISYITHSQQICPDQQQRCSKPFNIILTASNHHNRAPWRHDISTTGAPQVCASASSLKLSLKFSLSLFHTLTAILIANPSTQLTESNSPACEDTLKIKVSEFLCAMLCIFGWSGAG